MATRDPSHPSNRTVSEDEQRQRTEAGPTSHAHGTPFDLLAVPTFQVTGTTSLFHVPRSHSPPSGDLKRCGSQPGNDFLAYSRGMFGN
ncbi:hypothetical protein CRG98_032002 [Punica granatum]|uniref:Uncharacterized protein n=1 Tax=Punica granatum TaxID=22663 RepID=A0A2I0IV23_PUNGR|nr:hypothetical protein CRG98_032002 [Punica granatum]